MKPLRDYVNYRKYLRDFYREKKFVNPSYSYRLFSRLAGFAAPNLLKLVMDNQRNLSRESAHKFAKGLGLGTDTEYFVDLVDRNQGGLKERIGGRR
jgi:uncharacterized protein (TIGR02147 family)